ncbi:cytochrome c oxidase assembly protein COX15 homolog isoform X2 [Monomorium pharaonis]|uniref:cytochrome c oxidase assembly protein COX15 homolog isoform X2 n=1 Tax=Monomorium pharaonis TaxID=307658 RepID=UPI00063EEE72|nr:cytochrome c oxidase assembly protein COX15 homolog isoform X2 [Monomorium pharaonis]
MFNVVRYHTKVLGVYNATRHILGRQQHLFVRADVVRCNNVSLKEYCSKFLLQKRPLQRVNVVIRNYASKPSSKRDKIVGSWLLTCGGMVFVAVALGGITRLTESGLSMVTWKLLGEKMPLDETQWLSEFERYKQFPEYKITNYNMTLEEFKRIWWMEYLHRMWGRLIGGVFVIPATYFWYKDHLIPAEKLTANLSGTVITSSALKAVKRFKKLIHSTKGLVFLTALSGAFVAGMDAGLIYNTFPKMADKWIPDDILGISPVLRNFTENPATVQFDHRILGITTIALITCLGILSRKHRLPGRGRKAVAAVLCAGYLQVLLGISTLLYHVPLTLAASHQSGSLILLSTIIWLCHELRYLGKFAK